MQLQKESGMSLSTLLIGFGFVGVLATSFASVYFGQQRAMRSLNQRTEVLDLRKKLQDSFKTSDACDCAINAAVAEEETSGNAFLFDPTSTDGSQSLTVRNIKACKSSGTVLAEGQTLNSGLEVETISLTRLTPTSPGDRAQWNANWTVTFKKQSMAMSIPALEFPQKITLEPTTGKPSFIAKCVVQEEGHKPASLPSQEK